MIMSTVVLETCRGLE